MTSTSADLINVDEYICKIFQVRDQALGSFGGGDVWSLAPVWVGVPIHTVDGSVQVLHHHRNWFISLWYESSNICRRLAAKGKSLADFGFDQEVIDRFSSSPSSYNYNQNSEGERDQGVLINATPGSHPGDQPKHSWYTGLTLSFCLTNTSIVTSTIDQLDHDNDYPDHQPHNDFQ